MKKLISILVAMAMVLSLTVISAFALDETVNETADEDANLVKYLKIQEGVTIPDATFTFTFTPVATATVPSADLGDPVTATITPSQMAPSSSNADDGALVKALPLFGEGGIFEEYDFPHAGVYEFTVVETVTNRSTGTFGANTQEYTLRVYVTNTDVTVTVEGEQDEEEGEGTEPVKKDPSITDPSGTGDGSKTQSEITQTDVEGFSFVNDYTQNANEQPSGEYGAFHAQKTLSGDFTDETITYPITITVTFPTAYIGDKALNLYDENDAPIGALDPTTGSATVNLAKNGIAYIKNLPNGAVVTVNEDLTTSSILNAAHYYQTGVTTTGGVAAPEKTGTAKDGTASDVATNFIADTMTYLDANAKTENSVVINNENKTDVEPEGILISNLPYIALALVAIGGLVAYVVVRRKADDEA